MAEPDPTAGFDPDQFRADIRAAMLMGTPNIVDQRPTFHFADHRVFDNTDDAGAPLDWTVAPTGGAGPKDKVQVLCAVESIDSTTRETAMGDFDIDRAFLYLFEDEWAQVFDFTSVELGGSFYDRVKRAPPLALFEVDVQVIEVRARDES